MSWHSGPARIWMEDGWMVLMTMNPTNVYNLAQEGHFEISTAIRTKTKSFSQNVNEHYET